MVAFRTEFHLILRRRGRSTKYSNLQLKKKNKTKTKQKKNKQTKGRKGWFYTRNIRDDLGLQWSRRICRNRWLDYCYFGMQWLHVNHNELKLSNKHLSCRANWGLSTNAKQFRYARLWRTKTQGESNLPPCTTAWGRAGGTSLLVRSRVMWCFCEWHTP